MFGSIKHLSFVFMTIWILQGKNSRWWGKYEMKRERESINVKWQEFIGESQSLYFSLRVEFMSALSYPFSSLLIFPQFFFLIFCSHTSFKNPVCWNIIKMLNAHEFGICFFPQTTHIPSLVKLFNATSFNSFYNFFSHFLVSSFQQLL